MKRILTIAISILLMFLLVACEVAGPQGEQGIQGEQGNDGLSAFEIFLKYNPEYTGTEQDWIYGVTTNNVCALFGHKEIIDKAVDATCTIDGLTKGSHCEVCEKILIKQEVIEAKHNYVDGICSTCGDNNYNIVFTLSDDGESYCVSGYTGNDTELIIPSVYNKKPVTSIGNSAFKGCRNLISIEIPSSVTNIGHQAFTGCRNLISIKIPRSVTSIGIAALSSCVSLESITVDENNPCFDSRMDCNAIIETSTNTLRMGCKNTTIPSTITHIGEDAFLECRDLTSIEIPEGVTRIPLGAFCGCVSLESVTIPKSVTYIERAAFYNVPALKTVYYTGSKAQWKEININTNLEGNGPLLNATLICLGSEQDGFIYESNGDGTSSIVGVGTVIIIPEETPDGEQINRIASYTFSNLKNIIIEMPSTVQIIDDYAFYNCEIEEIRFSGTCEEWYNIDKNDGYWNYNSYGFTVICSDGEITY